MKPLDKLTHAWPWPTFKVTGGHFVTVCHTFVSCEHHSLRMGLATFIKLKKIDSLYEALGQVNSCMRLTYFQGHWWPFCSCLSHFCVLSHACEYSSLRTDTATVPKFKTYILYMKTLDKFTHAWHSPIFTRSLGVNSPSMVRPSVACEH